MKRKAILGWVLLAAGVVLSRPSKLQAADTRMVRLDRPMIISGVYLRAENYLVQWQLQGTHATVVFSSRGRTIATVQGKLKKLDISAPNDTFYFSKQPDGVFAINALGFANTRRAIIFPAMRAGPKRPNNNPATNLLFEDAWRSRPAPAPMVHR